jgi:hypothetical protein
LGRSLSTPSSWSRTAGLFAPLIPVTAALISLPLVLAVKTPLRAWRVQIIVAAAVPLVVSPESAQSPPWPPTVIFIALYLLYTVAVRLDLHLLIGVWLVTSATVFWSYLLPGQRNALAAANVGVLFLTVVLAYGYLIGTRRRLQQELVEASSSGRRIRRVARCSKSAHGSRASCTTSSPTTCR